MGWSSLFLYSSFILLRESSGDGAVSEDFHKSEERLLVKYRSGYHEHCRRIDDLEELLLGGSYCSETRRKCVNHADSASSSTCTIVLLCIHDPHMVCKSAAASGSYCACDSWRGLKLNDVWPDAQVAAVFPTQADVVAHQPHRSVGEEDKRRRQVDECDARQAAETANTEKTITVTELWKPHFGMLPLFADFGLE